MSPRSYDNLLSAFGVCYATHSGLPARYVIRYSFCIIHYFIDGCSSFMVFRRNGITRVVGR